MEQSRERFANEVDIALAQSARPFAIHNARKVDARLFNQRFDTRAGSKR